MAWRHYVEAAPNVALERRGVALPANEADLSQSSTPPWPTEDAPRDRSKQLLEFGATPSSKMPLYPCLKNRPDINADQSVPRLA